MQLPISAPIHLPFAASGPQRGSLRRPGGNFSENRRVCVAAMANAGRGEGARFAALLALCSGQG